MKNMFKKFNQILSYNKQNGPLATFILLLTRIFDIKSFKKINIIDKYANFFGNPFGGVSEAKKKSKNTINWFIPPFGKGSGGHLNIFRFIKNLESLGFENRIIIVELGHSLPSAKHLKSNIEKWFFPLKAEVYVGIKRKIPQSYFAFATSWETAYYVKRFNGCIKKCYFVQDYEPSFFSVGTDFVLAENTYKFDFSAFTAGSWLANKLRNKFNMETYSLGFSFDKSIYRPMPSNKKNDGIKRIFFYARPPTARRAFELGLLLFNEIFKERKNIEIIFAGWDLSDYDIPFPHKSLGLLNLDKLPTLYSQCDVALVLSLTNVSLLPLELMACKIPIVSNNGPNTEWLLNDQICVLADLDIYKLKVALFKILDEVKFTKNLTDKAYVYAQSTDWHNEAIKLKNYLEKL